MSLLAAAFALAVCVPQEKPSNAAADWQRIVDELAPKLVAHRVAPPDERARQTFVAERSRANEFFRRYEKSDPDLAWSARVWIAINVVRDALQHEREAADELLVIAKESSSGDAAESAAIQGGEGLLKLGDEEGLARLAQIYAARPDKSAAVVAHLDDLGRLVKLRPGRPFPELVLADLEGHRIDWKALRGSVVIVLVFNVESDPSRQALAQVAALAARCAKEPFAVVGVSLDVDRAHLTRELERLQVAFPVDFTGKEWNAPAAKALGLAQIPATFLLDPKGAIVEFRRGPLSPAFDELVERTLRAAREAGPAGR